MLTICLGCGLIHVDKAPGYGCERCAHVDHPTPANALALVPRPLTRSLASRPWRARRASA